ncbi:MAG: hypothetical protein U0936_24400 [Planctomycetaceae bacterium]
MIAYLGAMPQRINLSSRDEALLRLLDVTPLTTAQLRIVSATFPGEPFRDDRRVREPHAALKDAGFIRTFFAAVPGGGQTAYYRLTLDGHRMVFPGALNGH